MVSGGVEDPFEEWDGTVGNGIEFTLNKISVERGKWNFPLYNLGCLELGLEGNLKKLGLEATAMATTFRTGVEYRAENVIIGVELNLLSIGGELEVKVGEKFKVGGAVIAGISFSIEKNQPQKYLESKDFKVINGGKRMWNRNRITNCIRNLEDKIMQWKFFGIYCLVLVLYDLVFHEGGIEEKIVHYGETMLLCGVVFLAVYVVNYINMKLASSLKKYYGYICGIFYAICMIYTIISSVHFIINEFTEMPFAMWVISFAFYKIAFKAKTEM